MHLSLSCRIAEGFRSKKEATLSLDELADLAVAAGYRSICMRASQIGIHSPPEEVGRAREILDARDLSVTMISGDFDVVYNNDDGPASLRDIGPHLDLAEALGAPLIRVCLKTEDDISHARAAADAAAGRGLALVHQCHVQSLFETVAGIVDTLEKIGHPDFGLIFEPANLEECGQDYGPETIGRLAPWIRNVYLQNQRIKPDGAITLNTWCCGPVSFDILPIPEPGGIEFPRVFEGLRAVGYRGPMTVHQSGLEDGDAAASREAAARTAEFLRGMATETI